MFPTIQNIGLSFGALTNRTSTTRIIIHHTAGGTTGNLVGTGSAQNTHDAHLREGWAGLGYNFYIESGASAGSVNGRIVQGRGWNTVGAHTLNHNSNSMGIVLQGNFHYAPATRPTEGTSAVISGLTWRSIQSLSNTPKFDGQPWRSPRYVRTRKQCVSWGSLPFRYSTTSQQWQRLCRCTKCISYSCKAKYY